jgi:gluconolactonase
VSDGGGDAAVDGGATYPPLKLSDIGKPTKVSDQFYFTEGPVWDPAKGVLYFTDINGDPAPSDEAGAADDAATDSGAAEASTPDAAPQATGPGGVVYRLTPPSTLDVLFQPSGNADGLGLDPQGDLIGAGFFSRDAWRRASDGGLQTLSPCAADAGTCFDGTEINTPDDIASRSDGVLYFTDPTFASGSQGFPVLDLPLMSAQGVYRVTTDGVLHLEDTSSGGPNGVNLSPDEKTLYVSYTLTGLVAKFDVAADGSLSNKKTIVTGASVPDSMCVDAGGNLYVGTIGGLAVYDPAAKALGTISVDGLIVTNCAFGGADQKTLYVTARTDATLSGPPPFGGGLLYEIDAMPIPGMPGRN